MNKNSKRLLDRVSFRTSVGGVLAVVLSIAVYSLFFSPGPAPTPPPKVSNTPDRIVTVKGTRDNTEARPNFLFILSDDQSWEHTSFNKHPLVNTPNFDRIAKEGIYFQNAYAATPTCTGSRSAILAGQPVWRLGSSAMLNSHYSEQMISYQNILGQAGYSVGYSGKGWGPGRIAEERRTPHPPTGRQYNNIKQNVESHSEPNDLAASFEKFLDDTSPGQPYSFWVGSTDPHRPYKVGGNRFTKADDANYVPPFLPNTTVVQEQLSSYLDEIELFDRDVGKLLETLEERGLLENTVIIITSDNGMPFPRAKANNYLHGVRVPLSVRWGAVINKPGRLVSDFINLADIAPTLLDLAGVEIPAAMIGTSFAYTFSSDRSGYIDEHRDTTYSAFERHGGYIRGGEKNLTYPRRAIHTEDFVYIKNYFPDRWPAGDPPNYTEAFHFLLIDPKTLLPLEPYHAWATQKRPMEELYDLKQDPGQLHNVADEPKYANIKRKLADNLRNELIRTEDPLELTGVDVFQEYEYLRPYKPVPD